MRCICWDFSFQSGRPESAREMIDRAIAANPSSADYHRNSGVVFWRSGESQQALDSFGKALALRRGFWRPTAGIGGEAILQNGRSRSAAKEHLRRGAELAPDSAEILRCLADALQKAGRNDEAISNTAGLFRAGPMTLSD